MIGAASESPKPKIEIKEDNDIDHLYEWLILWFNNTESRPIQKVVNQIVNSYAPWRKIYTEPDRYKLAVEMIQKMVNLELIQKDSLGKISIIKNNK